MPTPTNELDSILLQSLKELSEHFQQREELLTRQLHAVSQRLDELTTRYEEGHALMQTILQRLNGPSSQSKK